MKIRIVNPTGDTILTKILTEGGKELRYVSAATIHLDARDGLIMADLSVFIAGEDEEPAIDTWVHCHPSEVEEYLGRIAAVRDVLNKVEGELLAIKGEG